MAVVALIAAAVIAVVVTRGGSSTAAVVPDQSQLVGLQTGPAPWNPGLDTLPDRLDAVGVHALTNEGQVLHIHQHLDIFVNGKHEPVPQGVGIYAGQFLTELHTHDPTGIIHVESPVAKHFDLGQFFGVWGVRLNARCIGRLLRPADAVDGLRERPAVHRQSGRARPGRAPGDRLRDRHAAEEDPLDRTSSQPVSSAYPSLAGVAKLVIRA